MNTLVSITQEKLIRDYDSFFLMENLTDIEIQKQAFKYTSSEFLSGMLFEKRGIQLGDLPRVNENSLGLNTGTNNGTNLSFIQRVESCVPMSHFESKPEIANIRESFDAAMVDFHKLDVKYVKRLLMGAACEACCMNNLENAFYYICGKFGQDFSVNILTNMEQAIQLDKIIWNSGMSVHIYGIEDWVSVAASKEHLWGHENAIYAFSGVTLGEKFAREDYFYIDKHRKSQAYQYFYSQGLTIPVSKKIIEIKLN